MRIRRLSMDSPWLKAPISEGVKISNMNIPRLLFNIREKASCPVCQDILKDPRYLPCLHSFCLHCLINWHGASGGQVHVRCPKCQGRSRVPTTGDLKDLPTSFFLSGFIDALAIKESGKTRVTCGNCDKKSSKTSYCFECCKFYCKKCLTGHNIMQSNKDHRVLAVKDFQEKDYEIVVKRPMFCPRKGHEKEELKLFCKLCPEHSVCQACVTLDHAGHKVILIQEEAEAQKIEIAGLIQAPRDKLHAKVKMISQIDEEYAQVAQRSENMLRDVDVVVDNLMRRLQEERQNIKAAVENETKKSLESLTTKKTSIQQEMKEIESGLEKAEELLTQSTDVEVVRLKKPLQTILERIGQLEPFERVPESLFELVYVENNKILETINSGGIGLLKFPSGTDASESVAEGKGLCEGTVGFGAQFILTTRNAAARQCYDGNDNVTVEWRDEQGQECITTFLVCDNKDGTYKISYSPTFGGHALLCDYFNHRVQVVQLNGKFVGEFGSHGINKGEFRNPTSVAILSNGQIVVSDYGNNRIQIFDEA
ncbi:E3 ubiquitin-protein ligase TRIM45-like [Montipora capricornis]|uniref:E3 ubiquitin-protein ligase TRIM45-like n=1 Tax=Montipora capricornis TaxID=246305 RepID=UPI0035F1C09F